MQDGVAQGQQVGLAAVLELVVCEYKGHLQAPVADALGRNPVAHGIEEHGDGQVAAPGDVADRFREVFRVDAAIELAGAGEVPVAPLRVGLSVAEGAKGGGLEQPRVVVGRVPAQDQGGEFGAPLRVATGQCLLGLAQDPVAPAHEVNEAPAALGGRRAPELGRIPFMYAEIADELLCRVVLGRAVHGAGVGVAVEEGGQRLEARAQLVRRFALEHEAHRLVVQVENRVAVRLDHRRDGLPAHDGPRQVGAEEVLHVEFQRLATRGRPLLRIAESGAADRVQVGQRRVQLVTEEHRAVCRQVQADFARRLAARVEQLELHAAGAEAPIGLDQPVRRQVATAAADELPAAAALVHVLLGRERGAEHVHGPQAHDRPDHLVLVAILRREVVPGVDRQLAAGHPRRVHELVRAGDMVHVVVRVHDGRDGLVADVGDGLRKQPAVGAVHAGVVDHQPFRTLDDDAVRRPAAEIAQQPHGRLADLAHVRGEVVLVGEEVVREGALHREQRAVQLEGAGVSGGVFGRVSRRGAGLTAGGKQGGQRQGGERCFHGGVPRAGALRMVPQWRPRATVMAGHCPQLRAR